MKSRNPGYVPASELRRGDVIRWQRVPWHQTGTWIVLTDAAGGQATVDRYSPLRRGVAHSVGRRMGRAATWDAGQRVWVYRRGVEIQTD